MVFNIVEKIKLIDSANLKSYEKAMFSFRGMVLPLIDLKKLLGTSSDNIINSSALIVELKINGYAELVGIPIDEVLEVTEIDDILSYPYCSIAKEKQGNLRETLLIKNEEPIIMLNTDKIFSEEFLETKPEKSIVELSN
jgi:chemotaxis signal transduction protein